MTSTTSESREQSQQGNEASPQPNSLPRSSEGAVHKILSELRAQRGLALPLTMMNLTTFAKTAVTTAFLGRLGEAELAGGALGFTFANVTGFSVLSGLCGAMEPICGQAFGAGNHKLLRKTLLMATLLLLGTSVLISFLWFNVEKVLMCFGQQRDITRIAKKYVTYLLPDLLITSFLSPLKAYLSSQGVTLPTLFSSALGLAFHVPITFLLSKAKGLEGVSMAIWLTDLSVVVVLGLYVLASESMKKKGAHDKVGGEEGEGWWKQTTQDWLCLLRLSLPCCLNTCLEWWCWEILILLAGRLPDARRSVAVLAVVLNFDYLLFSVMLSLATCASVRISNELGAGKAGAAHISALISLSQSLIVGLLGGSAMVAMRRSWGALFSHDPGVISGVSRMLLLMGVVEVVNFPLAICGGIARGTARPWLGMYASLGGFYLVALPLAVLLAFRVRLGLQGLLLGFLVGGGVSLVLLVLFVACCINWNEEACKAQKLAGVKHSETGDDGTQLIDCTRP